MQNLNYREWYHISRSRIPGCSLFKAYSTSTSVSCLGISTCLFTQESAAHLKEEGWLILEIGCGQGEAVSGLLKAAGFDGVEIIKLRPVCFFCIPYKPPPMVSGRSAPSSAFGNGSGHLPHQ